MNYSANINGIKVNAEYSDLTKVKEEIEARLTLFV